MFDVYLNGTKVNEWANWQSFEREIVRNDTLKMYTVQTTTSFEFTGDGYDVLVDAVETLGVTETIPGSVVYRENDSSSKTLLSGIVCLSSVKYTARETAGECKASCLILSGAISEFIIANRSAAFYIGEGKSLLNNPITPASPLDIQMFNPATGGLIAGSVRGYDVKECFAELFAALSEEQILFESTWYDSLPTDERFILTTGLNVRQINNETPQISLESLFDEIQKKYNLWLFSEQINGTNVIRLEEESFLTQSGSLTLTDVYDVQVSTDEQRLYTSINVGSSTSIKDFLNEYSLPYIPLATHVEETFPIATPCNEGVDLDLVSRIIIDSNSIEDAITPLDNDDNDDELFIIQYDNITLEAVSATLLAASEFYYNEALLNVNVVNRWRVQGSIGENFIETINHFKVGATTDSSLRFLSSFWNPAPLDDDTTGSFFNDNGVWSTTNYEFTVQQTGVYKFTGEFIIEYVANPNSEVTNEIANLGIFSPDDVLLRTEFLGGNAGVIIPTGGISNATFTNTPIYLQQGQIVKYLPEVQITSTFGGLQYKFLAINLSDQTFLELVSQETTQDLLQPTDPNTYFSKIITFDHPLSKDEWLSLEANPTQRIDLQKTVPTGTQGLQNPIIESGWARSIKTNFVTGETSWELISNPLRVPFQ